MEAKDFMIGDWVRITRSQWHEGSTQKVLDVYENGSIRTKHISPVLKDSYEPIPITTEILELNGFVIRPSQAYLNDGIFLDNGLDGNAYWWQIGHCPICAINYVHQLQHALRLCGLSDLADNFKI